MRIVQTLLLHGAGALLAHGSTVAKETLVLHEFDAPQPWFNEDSQKIRHISKTADETHLIDLHGDRSNHQNLLLFASALPKAIKVQEIVQFARRGGNILWIMTGGEPDNAAKQLAEELGRKFESKLPLVHDFVGNKNNVLTIKGQVASVIKDRWHLPERSSITKARAHQLDANNPLVFPLVTASRTAVAKCGKGISIENCTNVHGTDIVIASALQSRLNSRITIVTANNLDVDLLRSLMDWTFGVTGLLRVDSYEHRHLEPSRDDGLGYRVNDQINIRLCLSENRNGQWTKTQPDDVQIELVMIDAWLRADLHLTKDGCLESGPLRLPGRYGVYTLRLVYQRRGWPHLIKQERLILRPMHVEEISRHLPSALPYYVGWVSILLASTLLLHPFAFPRNQVQMKGS